MTKQTNLLTRLEICEIMQKQIQGETLSVDEEKLFNEDLKKHTLKHFFLYAIEAMRYDYGKPSRDYRKERLKAHIKSPRVLDQDYASNRKT